MPTATALPTAATASDSHGWLPPRDVLRIYALAWAPVLLIYLVAVETDGVWSRGFNLASALHGTVRNMGPQFLLLLLLWPATGWMERRRLSAAWQVLAQEFERFYLFVPTACRHASTPRSAW